MNLLDRVSSSQARELSAAQIHVDQLVGSFVQNATDWQALAAMAAGGLSYRLARIGTMPLSQAGTPLLSATVGLAAEAATFEGAHRSLATLVAPTSGRPQNLWRWSGHSGLQEGFVHSFVTFGSLKSAGRAVRAENIFVQHLFQDTAMVLGRHAAAGLGAGTTPQGSLAEQFLEAEVTNLQVSAGMALGRGLARGLHDFERSLLLVESSRRDSLRPMFEQAPLLRPVASTGPGGRILNEAGTPWRIEGGGGERKTVAQLLEALQRKKTNPPPPIGTSAQAENGKIVPHSIEILEKPEAQNSKDQSAPPSIDALAKLENGEVASSDWDVKTPTNTETVVIAGSELVLASRKSNEKILRGDLKEFQARAVHYSLGRLSLGTGFSGLALGPGRVPVHATVDPQTGQITALGKIQSLPEDILENGAEIVFIVQIHPKNFNGDYESLGDFKPHISKIHLLQPERMSSEARETLLELKGAAFRFLNDPARTSGVFLSNEKIIRGELREIHAANVYYVVEKESMGGNAGRGKFAATAMVDPETGQISAVGHTNHLPPSVSEGKVGVSFLVQAVPDNFRGNLNELGNFKPRVVEVYLHNPDVMSDRAQEILSETIGLPFGTLKSSYRPEGIPQPPAFPTHAAGRTTFALDAQNKALLQKILGRRLGDSLSLSEWRQIKPTLERLAFPPDNQPKPENNAAFARLYLKLVQHFSMG